MEEDLGAEAGLPNVGEVAGEQPVRAILRHHGSSVSMNGADDDQTIRDAFMTFDENGKIDTNKLKHALVTWGDKFSAKEVADALECMGADGRGHVVTEEVVQMLTAGGDEE